MALTAAGIDHVGDRDHRRPPLASISLTTASASARLQRTLTTTAAPRRRELQRHGAPDAAAGAGDDGDAACEFLVSHFPAYPLADAQPQRADRVRSIRPAEHVSIASFSAACARAAS